MTGRPPDLEFLTSAKAKEVRFGRVPERRKVTYYGEPGHETEAKVERENIPEEPEAGTTYGDVKVDWKVKQWIVHPVETGHGDREKEEDG